MDFCAYLADGSFWRFHPGTRKKSSAEPRFFPEELPSTGLQPTMRAAAEHAWLQWRTASEDGVWTSDRARLVPQIDRMGKKRVWQVIAKCLAEEAIPWQPQWVDITDGTHLRWWLWTCNLGPNTEEVIGTGIYAAKLARPAPEEVLSTFRHVGTETARVVLGLGRRGGGFAVYTRAG